MINPENRMQRISANENIYFCAIRCYMYVLPATHKEHICVIVRGYAYALRLTRETNLYSKNAYVLVHDSRSNLGWTQHSNLFLFIFLARVHNNIATRVREFSAKNHCSWRMSSWMWANSQRIIRDNWQLRRIEMNITVNSLTINIAASVNLVLSLSYYGWTICNTYFKQIISKYIWTLKFCDVIIVCILLCCAANRIFTQHLLTCSSVLKVCINEQCRYIKPLQDSQILNCSRFREGGANLGKSNSRKPLMWSI